MHYHGLLAPQWLQKDGAGTGLMPKENAGAAFMVIQKGITDG
jgi:hypothetical protein